MTTANHNPGNMGVHPRIMSQTGGVGIGSRASMGVMFAISQGGEIHRIPSKGGIIVSASNQHLGIGGKRASELNRLTYGSFVNLGAKNMYIQH